MNNKKLPKKLGGLYGALLGDACGCPYEFQSASKIPPHDQIEMIPPADFGRSWKKIPVGTYTDDGAQALCLLDTLTGDATADFLVRLRAKLVAWLGGGYMSVDNVTFDSGMQTKKALMYCDSTKVVIEELSREMDSGNGSLMRSIPVALVATDLTLAMKVGALQSLVTHPNARCQMTCALYSGIAYLMLTGSDADQVYDTVFLKACNVFPQHIDELKFIDAAQNNEVGGTGYVVDAFWSALHALRNGKTFKDVIKNAIALGNDTDTTACIAGGLAGIKFGYDGLPTDWMNLLRGRNLIDPLASRLT